MKRMKIAIIHSFYSSSEPSGENNVVVDQINALQLAGHEVYLYAKRTDELESQSLYKLSTAVRVALGHDRKPLDFLRSVNPDIVHIHNLFPNIGTSWISEWEGPIVASIHNYRSVCSNGFLYRDKEMCFECPTKGNLKAVQHSCYRGSRIATAPLAVSRGFYQKDVLSRADRVIATSMTAQQVLMKTSKWNMQTVVIPNFGEGDSQVPLLATERKGFVALGRLSPEKGFLELTEIWPTGWELTVIGDGSEYELIYQTCTRKGIDLIPSMPREKLRKLLAQYRGLVFPSRWLEVAPQVVVESMRLGLPVISYSRNGIARIVEDSGAGAVYSNSQSLVQAIDYVSGQLEELSVLACQYYDATWHPVVWLKSIEQIYATILKERAA